MTHCQRPLGIAWFLRLIPKFLHCHFPYFTGAVRSCNHFTDLAAHVCVLGKCTPQQLTSVVCALGECQAWWLVESLQKRNGNQWVSSVNFSSCPIRLKKRRNVITSNKVKKVWLNTVFFPRKKSVLSWKHDDVISALCHIDRASLTQT